MTTENAQQIARLATIDGLPFIAYAGQRETVFIERIRPDGRRDAASIFHFEAASLVAAIEQVAVDVAASTGSIAVVSPTTGSIPRIAAS